MEVKAFYDALGELCRAHGSRKLACDDCPASRFCYTAPASVTGEMLDAVIAAASIRSADGATKRNSTVFPIRSDRCTSDEIVDRNK